MNPVKNAWTACGPSLPYVVVQVTLPSLSGSWGPQPRPPPLSLKVISPEAAAGVTVAV